MTNIILSIWIQNSRFKAQKEKKNNPISLAEGLRIQEDFFGSWINLESLAPWIQEVFLGSWILNLAPLDSRSLFGILNLESCPVEFKKSFWDLESWILNPMYLGKGGMGTNLQNKCNSWSPKNALSLRVQNVKKNAVNTTKFVWKVGLGGGYHTYIYIYKLYKPT